MGLIWRNHRLQVSDGRAIIHRDEGDSFHGAHSVDVAVDDDGDVGVWIPGQKPGDGLGHILRVMHRLDIVQDWR